MFDEQQPIYRQIAEQIRQDILTGRLEEEEQVMSTNQYAAYYRINPATAQKAFQQLVDEGVLYKKRGIGMFVSSGTQEMLRQRHRERFYESVVDPMLTEARSIGVDLDEIATYIQERKERDNEV